MSNSTTIRLGTRKSALARWQANWVAGQLRQRGVEVAIVLLTTEGDVSAGSLGQIGGQGVFTKEIQRALLEGRIDLAVHSLKDVPTEEVAGLTLAAVPPREANGDVLALPAGHKVVVESLPDSDSETAANQASGAAPDFPPLDQLPPAARVGTGSSRRRAQLLHYRGDLVVEDIRGNVDTRLKKLDEGQYDAIVLAEAGLRRLELFERISHVIPKWLMLPAVGQGALGLETRADDNSTRSAVAALDDGDTHAAVIAERAMLAALRGGCLAPVGAWARLEEEQLLRLDAVVLAHDGAKRLTAQVSGPPAAADQLGREAAEQLRSQGAEELIAASRE